MARDTKRTPSFKLPSVDDLFTSQEEREVESLTSGRIMDIPIAEIDDFVDHPFLVRDDEEMELLANSIKENGVIEPATVRKKDDGRYEMISGHRRKFASAKVGLTTIRCEVVDVTRDAAILQMVESNFHREHILPSEKAKAYKMRLDAMKRQGQRTDLIEVAATSVPLGPKLEDELLDSTSSPLATKLKKGRSDEELAEQVGESKDNIRRYISLNNLEPEILQMVDEGKIKMRPACEIAALPHDKQKILLDAMNMGACTPSHAQALTMKKMHQAGNLAEKDIREIMKQAKPNQREKSIFPKCIKDLFPENTPDKVIETKLVKAFNFWRSCGKDDADIKPKKEGKIHIKEI